MKPSQLAFPPRCSRSQALSGRFSGVREFASVATLVLLTFAVAALTLSCATQARPKPRPRLVSETPYLNWVPATVIQAAVPLLCGEPVRQCDSLAKGEKVSVSWVSKAETYAVFSPRGYFGSVPASALDFPLSVKAMDASLEANFDAQKDATAREIAAERGLPKFVVHTVTSRCDIFVAAYSNAYAVVDAEQCRVPTERAVGYGDLASQGAKTLLLDGSSCGARVLQARTYESDAVSRQRKLCGE